MTGSVLDRDTILQLIRSTEPLVTGYVDLEAQLQPNGVDLTLRDVSTFTSAGVLGPGPAPARLPESVHLPFDTEGYVSLAPGCYLATLNEIVSLPLGVMALARPRSSLLRSGVAVHTAVWDAGYRGRSQTLVTVHNPGGFRLARNARVIQMVFLYLSAEASSGYGGRFQGENIDQG